MMNNIKLENEAMKKFMEKFKEAAAKKAETPKKENTKSLNEVIEDMKKKIEAANK